MYFKVYKMVNIPFVFCWSMSISVLSLAHSDHGPPETCVAQGRLRGKWFTTRGNRKVAGFLGIPYAAPPVGSLRFESPRPGMPWEGILLAIEDTPGCIQNLIRVLVPGVSPKKTSENCLHLNVYSPDLKPCKQLPVIVFFYGGSFESGTSYSTDYGPEYILDHDIVLVTFNYRLGILGFLSLGDDVLPGNLGLKDQREALRWVKANIAQFGGDPAKVTIMGQSAGAISVHYHLIFTSNEGLFRAAIAESGSSRTFPNLLRCQSQKPLLRKLTKMTNCPSDSFKLVECLRKIPAEEFPKILEELRKTDSLVKVRQPILTPVIEPCCVKDALITSDPFYATTSFPVLQGANHGEGYLFITGFIADRSDSLLRLFDENFDDVAPYVLYFDRTARQPKNVAEAIRRFYFRNEPIDRKHIPNISDLVGDTFVNFPLVAAARANRRKTYFYQMNYEGANSVLNFYGVYEYNTTHSDELFFLFPLRDPNRNVTEKDTAFSKIFVRLWTNFATYLDPTPPGSPFKWNPVATDSIEFLNIGQHSLTMDKNFLKRRMDFWSGLPYRNKQQPCN